MLYGGNNPTEVTGGVSQRMIQKITHEYFHHPVSAEDLPDEKEELEEQSLRAHAGGLVFDVEQSAVLRSSCIVAVAELILSSPSTFCIPHVAELVKLVNDVLDLEQSRPVLRAAAFLASSLYMAVRQGDEGSGLEVARQLILAGEEPVRSKLERYATEWVDHERLYDPAFVARCEEALEMRSHIEHMFGIASTALASGSLESSTQAFIRREMLT